MSIVDLDTFVSDVVAAQDARDAEVDSILARGQRALDAYRAARRCEVCAGLMQLRTRTVPMGAFVHRVDLWDCAAHPFKGAGR